MYRAEVLGKTLAQGLTKVQPQTLRTRLTAWKHHHSEAYFAQGVCACCATFKRKAKLQEVIFTKPQSEEPPSWLEWSVDQWLRYREAWYCRQFNKDSLHVWFQIGDPLAHFGFGNC